MVSNYELHLACYVMAFIVSVSCLLYTLLRGRTDKLQNKIYLAMVIIVTLNTCSGIAEALAAPYVGVSKTARGVLYTAQYLYFLLHTLLCPAFFYYVCCVVGSIRSISPRRGLVFGSLLIVTECFVLTNPIFYFVYYYDEDFAFHRNWAENLIYAAAAVYLVFAITMLLFRWRAVNFKRRFALMYFFFLAVLGVVIQMVEINIKSELFTEGLALIGIMLAVEFEDDLVDADTGFYNRKALDMDVTSYLVNRMRFDLICIKVTNSDMIQRVTGSSNADILAEVLSGYLRSIVPRHHIYQTNPETFVLALMHPDRQNGGEIAAQIADRFDQPWDCRMTEIRLSAVVMVVHAPEKLSDTSELFYMVDRVTIPKDSAKRVLTDRDLDNILRREEIEKAIARSLDEGGFEVYYQPTINTDGLSLHGAEALIRMNDRVLGRLFPDEFIPVAEQVGMIDAIDDFVLREVCEFLERGTPQKYGIDSINVNLSVIQCLQPGFTEHICRLVEPYRIEKASINFEITESVAASDYDDLSRVVARLKTEGFRFSMDDYGTGFSNMQSILSLDFNVIKIDKSILWGADETELGKIILENSVNMIKQMKRKILVEGVETSEQVQLLKELSVDYLQGYYFSRPIPQEEFIKFIRTYAAAS